MRQKASRNLPRSRCWESCSWLLLLWLVEHSADDVASRVVTLRPRKCNGLRSRPSRCSARLVDGGTRRLAKTPPPEDEFVNPGRVRVSFVVLSFNSARVIGRCVRSLIAQADASGQDEIWVVDNGSTDGSAERLRALQESFPDFVRPLYLPRNFGTTVSRNQALRRAQGTYIAVIDSDVYVPPGTVARLVADLEDHPGAGLIAPRLVFPDGRLQFSVDRFPTPMHKARRYFALRAMERRRNDRPGPCDVNEVDYAISAFWLMRRSVLEQVGLLDERIFYAPEDVDYCLRVWKAGYAVLYDAAVHAVHDAQEISRGVPWRRATFSHAAGLFYLFTKHRCWLGRGSVYRAIRSARSVASARPAGDRSIA